VPDALTVSTEPVATISVGRAPIRPHQFVFVAIRV